MKHLLLTFVLGLLVSVSSLAQTETTDEFHESHDEAFTLFFYKNTLRMYFQDNEEYQELIRDIDKMKLLRIEKASSNFTRNEYNRLVESYQEEAFEDLMNFRSEGANLNVFIKEKDKTTLGLVVLMEDEENFSILDIKGAVPLQRIAELISKLKSAESIDWD